ncbi:OsmC family protein [Thermococcus gammatolerans]|uniref:OsmC-like stress-induced protein (OsmC) n=1 Tax=Thermococcus gammatolerans (strain DSM 15229 / JCM 11827 / EJ3) TaxID=593117 RepID=C5A525_THEGJ|nr:OsmC family protein [Thermococcus gammatolerans]ACS33337.1 OsmC-like stress-induced protein (OsmC) [Thermococcus gammatolerans EJ3]
MERLEYNAELKWDGNVGSEAKVREFSFRIDTNTDGNNTGPNPTEYLLAAIGGCLTVNWGRLIKKMRLKVDGMEITVSGWRDRKEPQLREITYEVCIVTDEPEKKILRVKELAEKYGTVFNTVGAKKIKGKVEIIRPK